MIPPTRHRAEETAEAIRVTRIGVSTWVWTSPLTDADLATIGERISGYGYDTIELPIENLDDWSSELAVDVLGRTGLDATTCAVMATGRSLVSPDAVVRRATQAYLRGCVDKAGSVGATVVAGPMYAPTGWVSRFTTGERNTLTSQLAESLRPVADYAGSHGVRLALEPLNRYETSLINTVDQAMEIIDDVQSPALGVCLDTFHLNIEEKDPAAAVLSAGTAIAHVQACGTDRGTPGADRFDWPRFTRALATVDYAGPVCIESFTGENEAIARAASIWRPLAPSQDQLAIDGLAFLRTTFDLRRRTNG